MKKILIIGASYLQLPLIKKAKDIGLETHVFAWEEGAVGKKISDFFYPISIIEKERILEVAKSISPDGVISIASDLAIATVNYLSNKLGLIGNTMETTRQTTNKYIMRKKLMSGGFPCPEFVLCHEGTYIEPNDFQYPVIVKPTDRSGSRGITKVLQQDKLTKAIERAKKESFNSEVLIEEFIKGNEISVEMISCKGKHFPLAITDKITSGDPYFVEFEHHQPSAIGDKCSEEILSMVTSALDCLGVENGASHSELLLTSDGRNVFVEIGARMGGDCIGSDLVELSTGYDFVKGVIEIALDTFTGVKKKQSNYSGIYFIKNNSGKVIEVEDKTCKYSQIIRKEINVKLGDKLNPIMESGDRLGYYIYSDIKKFVPHADLIHIKTV